MTSKCIKWNLVAYLVVPSPTLHQHGYIIYVFWIPWFCIPCLLLVMFFLLLLDLLFCHNQTLFYRSLCLIWMYLCEYPPMEHWLWYWCFYHNHYRKKDKKKKKKKKQNEDVPASITEKKPTAEKESIPEKQEKEEAKSMQVRTFPNGLVIEELVMGKPNAKRASPGKKVILFLLLINNPVCIWNMFMVFRATKGFIEYKLFYFQIFWSFFSNAGQCPLCWQAEEEWQNFWLKHWKSTI